MSNSYICRVCGASFPEDELTLMDDELLCETCLDEETLVCADCGTRIWSEQNVGSSEHPLCQRCFDCGYTTCERCGAVLSFDSVFYLDDEEDTPYCESCCDLLRNRAIHDYSYRPEPIFYGDAPRYFGVELEIDGAGEVGSNAEKILAIGNRDAERVYCKHDGSLDDGFEIVSHPATLACHMQDFPWEQMMKKPFSSATAPIRRELAACTSISAAKPLVQARWSRRPALRGFCSSLKRTGTSF